jgi:membrane-associated phospholipid phosphatase
MNISRLLLQTVGALFLCAGLVTVSFFCVDWPVAVWVHEHANVAPSWLRNPPDVVTGLVYISPVLLLLALLKRWWKPWQREEALAIAGFLNIVVAAALKYLLKWIFGRPGPNMWFGQGHFLTDQSQFVFHWFHGHPDDGFPSGHMAIVCALCAMVWETWPKWRWLAVGTIFVAAISLVITNYHFVGDTIAGGCIGWLAGLWTLRRSLPWLGLAECNSRDSLQRANN